MSNGSRPEATGSRANTIITALASVLGAVILASGGIIAATYRAKDAAQDETGELRKQLVAKNTENQNLRGQIIALSERLNRRPEPEPVPAGDQEEDGFRISRPECQRSGMLVSCNFKIANNGVARHIRLHARPDLFHNSRALTNQGPLIHANGAVVAGVEGPLPELDVPSRVALPASVKFRDVPPEVTAFTVLTIGVEIAGDAHEIEFRDVHIP